MNTETAPAPPPASASSHPVLDAVKTVPKGPLQRPVPKSTSTTGATAAAQLTTSPFAIDHRGEVIKEMRNEAAKSDRTAAIALIDGDIAKHDLHADLARSLRTSAAHLELIES